MIENEYKCLLVSTFTNDIFAGYLNSDKQFPKVRSKSAPFDQVFQVLADENSEHWRDDPDFALIWTQPENVIKSFNHMINYEPVSMNDLLADVDEFSSQIIDASNRVRAAFIPTWVVPAYNTGLGMLDMKSPLGLSNGLMRMNLRLAENMENAPNVFLFDTQRWINAANSAFVPKLWYMAKLPFGKEVFKEAVKDIKSAIRGICGHSKKLMALDLDDTLWGGIVGDAGWKNLKLGGHDYIGEAYADFQRALKAMTNRGILLGIVSKNEESVALEAIREHPEMVLKLDDFAGWKINWNDKAQNLSDLVSELNLGLQSVVFIDDNPFERARVREALPEVYVPEWPEDKTLYKSTLLSLRCFDTCSIGREDRERAQMYVAERQRKESKAEVSSLDDWLKGLNIKVEIGNVNETNLQRTAQLLNKTNQMNLTTRRMTDSELMEWASGDNRKLWTFRVSDKFGDSGLTGILSLDLENGQGRIVDFILSCRVMGRNVEEAMIYSAIQYAKSIGLTQISAEYVPTPKNKPCLDFWKRSGFKRVEEDNVFMWNMDDNFSVPAHIELV